MKKTSQTDAENKIKKICDEKGYTYESFAYTGVKTRIFLTCSENHKWNMSYTNLVNIGSGCRVCSNNKNSNLNVFSESDVSKIISEFSEKTGYKVEPFIFKNTKTTRVIINCNNENHPSWETGFRSLYRPLSKCPVCRRVDNGKKTRITQKKAEDNVKIVCKEKKLSYKKFVYKTCSSTFIKVKCQVHPEHDEYDISYTRLVHGRHICKFCNKNGYIKDNNKSYFYINEIYNPHNTNEKFLKFGISKNPKRRLKEYKNNLYKTKKILCYEFNNGYVPFNIEKIIKAKIKTSVLSKHEYKSGYTETAHYSDLCEIIGILNDYVKSNKIHFNKV